eukprot:1740265-Rhodomonas_salina.3
MLKGWGDVKTTWWQDSNKPKQGGKFAPQARWLLFYPLIPVVSQRKLPGAIKDTLLFMGIDDPA